MIRRGLRTSVAVAAVTAVVLTGSGGAAWARRAPLPPPQPTYDLRTEARVQVDGTAADARLGIGLAVGDVNGDGESDLAVASETTGVWVMFGPIGPGVVDLASDPRDGFRILTGGDLTDDPMNDIPLRSAGDVNGDGRDDLLVRGPSGRTYVVFGKTDTAEVSVTALGGHGFDIRFKGVAAFDGAGDVNGDGRDDVVVGGSGIDEQTRGDAFVVFGRATTETVSVDSMGSGGYRLRAPSPVTAVAGAGDVDGDGRDDVLVGSSAHVTRAGITGGAAWVCFGKADSAQVRLGDLGGAGYRIEGTRPDQLVGRDVVPGGDVNGDGVPDQLVLGVSPNAVNRVYVVFGSATSTRTVRLDDAGFRGYPITAPPDDQGLWRPSLAGDFDVNGDGLADQAIGTFLDGVGSRDGSGIVYVVYGQTAAQPIALDTYPDGFRIGGLAAYANYGRSVAAFPNSGRVEIAGGAYSNPASGRSYSGSVFLAGPPALVAPPAPDLGDVRLGADPVARSAPSAAPRARLSATVSATAALTVTMDVRRFVPGRRSGPQRTRCAPAAGTVPKARACTALQRVRSVRRVVSDPGTATLTLPGTLPAGRYRVAVWGTDASTGRVSGPFTGEVRYSRRWIVTAG